MCLLNAECAVFIKLLARKSQRIDKRNVLTDHKCIEGLLGFVEKATSPLVEQFSGLCRIETCRSV